MVSRADKVRARIKFFHMRYDKVKNKYDKTVFESSKETLLWKLSQIEIEIQALEEELIRLTDKHEQGMYALSFSSKYNKNI